MSAVVIQGNAVRLPIGTASVDLVVTSPPYFALRSYLDGGAHYDGQIGAEDGPAGYVEQLVQVTRELVRVLAPTGSIWVNLGDKFSGAQQQNSGRQSKASSSTYWKATNPKVTGIPNKSLMGLPWRYALACIDELGLALRAEVIWSKPNGLPESVRDRVRRSHEQWFHFTKQDSYYSDLDQIREPYAAASHERAAYGFDSSMKGRMLGSPTDTRESATPGWQPSPLGRIPGSVWSIGSEALRDVPESLGVQHFAAFPSEWPRRLIKAWCPPSGAVLDPFGGTGTTAMVANELGRTGISVDLSHDYSRLARWRCRQTQPSLFDEGAA